VPRRIFNFDPPDQFRAIAVGRPGQRAFYLQATKGDAIVSLAIEKSQVAALATRLVQLVEEAQRRGLALDAGEASGPATSTEEVIEQFRVGTMAVAWDGESEHVVVEALAMDDEPIDDPEVLSDEDDGPDALRVRMPGPAALAFADAAARLVDAGRPPCPLCGEPLDPGGHICLRRNGYLN